MKCGRRKRKRDDIAISQSLERIARKERERENERMKKRRRDFKVKCQKKMIAQRVEESELSATTRPLDKEHKRRVTHVVFHLFFSFHSLLVVKRIGDFER